MSVPRVDGLIGRARLLMQGADVAAEWLAHGNLDIEQRAVMAEGGKAFLSAIAKGQVVGQREYELRLSTCRDCPSKTVGSARPGVAESSWCGKPLTPDLENETRPTCGCLIVLRAACSEKDCPQNKWP